MGDALEQKKDRGELEAELQDQLGFLRRSAIAYDAGEISEAKRLATVLYILVHEGPQNKSLLKKLGIRSRLPLLSTAFKAEAGEHWLRVCPPLTILQMGEGTSKFLPLCSDNNSLPSWSRPLSFQQWWEESIATEGNRPLSRKGLVFFVRSQDGGSHVDHKRRGESYIDFLGSPASRGVSFYRGANRDIFTPSNPHLASIRQVAWELDQALNQMGF